MIYQLVLHFTVRQLQRNNERNKMSTLQSLTKWQNTKKALGNTVAVGVSEVVFCATIEWE